MHLTDQEFQQLAGYLKAHFGIHLNIHKKALVIGRLGGVLRRLNMGSFSEFMDYLVSDESGEAAGLLANHMTTNHTFFMREADHFHFFRDRILPEVMPRLEERDLRVWSAGCSSGEEPYTLAMLIDEHLNGARLGWDTKLLATDISEKVLNRAVQGIYSAEAIEALPKRWKVSYFQPLADGCYQVKERIRNEVLFRRFNLMDPFPFRKKFHVIFCRNVMIYFDAVTRRTLVRKFYDALEPGGYLFIGHSETIQRGDGLFHYVRPAIYRKL